MPPTSSIPVNGAMLRDARQTARLTAQALSERIGFTVSNVLRLEQGRGGASLSYLDAVAHVLGKDEVAPCILSAEDRRKFVAGYRSATPE